MDIKIPKRGPVDIYLDNGQSLELWYNRAIRLWTLQHKDVEGNQIGPGFGGEASYNHDRKDAVDELKELVEKFGK